ncbi:hypothetical protein LENED_011535 [Lentinula edodes]|uniref:Uncharacterized protein n=1 Tax=Lentinula edodes TaxID=5353 RepID=A0A1Q3EQC2_LENED|nr:hypothetical protein LENED_011535 [Lentinula edodes]
MVGCSSLKDSFTLPPAFVLTLLYLILSSTNYTHSTSPFLLLYASSHQSLSLHYSCGHGKTSYILSGFLVDFGSKPTTFTFWDKTYAWGPRWKFRIIKHYGGGVERYFFPSSIAV